MSNIPILHRNVMDGLPSDFARDAFLWADGRFPNDRCLYKAEAFAREADDLRLGFSALIDMAQFAAFKAGGHVMTEGQREDLLSFMLTRHANHRTPGNARPKYCEATP